MTLFVDILVTVTLPIIVLVALGWLLHQNHVTSVIIGTRRMEQLADNLGAVDVALDTSDLAALDAVSALAPEYPGWMVDRQGMDRRGQV